MPKSQQNIGYVELARILVREYKIHEGHWHVALTFGTTGGILANLATDDKGGTKMLPAAVVPVLGLCLLQSKEPTALTVDASVVNPKPLIVQPNAGARNSFFN